MATEYRAEFDADVAFLNGGGLQAQGFRIDVPSADMADEELGAAFVRHLGLLMVDRVRLSNVRILAEAHKGSRDTIPNAGGDSVGDSGTERIVDLAHPVEAGMTTYPGLPGPQITDHLSRDDSRSHYAGGTEFAIQRISMVGNTGTYLDSPFHRFADGIDLAGLALDRLVDLPTIVVHLADSGRSAIDVPALAPFDVASCAVLLHTGWDRHWRTEHYGDGIAPHLTAAAAAWLVEHDARIVGIDSVNIDDLADLERPAHSILLRAGIPIIEHLTNLAELPARGARLHAAPIPVVGLGTVAVRAYARVRRS